MFNEGEDIPIYGVQQPGPQPGSLPKGSLPPGAPQKLLTAQKTLPTAEKGLVTRRDLATRRAIAQRPAPAPGSRATPQEPPIHLGRVGTETLRAKHKPIDFGKISKTVKRAMSGRRFKGVDINRSTAKLSVEIQARLDEWASLKPSKYHTVEGMDAFRKSIGDIRDSTEYGTPSRGLADKVYFAVRKSIEAEAPEYGKVLSEYHQASTHLRNLERSLSLGHNAAVETSLRKLQAVMRNDVTSAYGKRAEYARDLKGAGATKLDAMLAGQALQTWMPRALASRVGSLGTGAAGVSGMISPYALPLVAAASPRIVGMGAYRAGQASNR